MMVVNRDILRRQKDQIRDFLRWVQSLFSDGPFEVDFHAISKRACNLEDLFEHLLMKPFDTAFPSRIQQLRRYTFVPLKRLPYFSFMTPETWRLDSLHILPDVILGSFAYSGFHCFRSFRCTLSSASTARFDLEKHPKMRLYVPFAVWLTHLHPL